MRIGLVHTGRVFTSKLLALSAGVILIGSISGCSEGVPNENAPSLQFVGVHSYEGDIPVFKYGPPLDKEEIIIDFSGIIENGFVEVVDDETYQKAISEDLRFGQSHGGVFYRMSDGLDQIAIPINGLDPGNKLSKKYWVRGARFSSNTDVRKYSKLLYMLDLLSYQLINWQSEKYSGNYVEKMKGDSDNYAFYNVSRYYPILISSNQDDSIGDSKTTLRRSPKDVDSIKEGLFELTIPSKYIRVVGAELSQLQQMMMVGGKDLAKRSKSADPNEFDETALTFFSAFKSADQQTTIVLMGMSAGGEWVRDETYATNSQRIEWGVDTGRLSKNSNGVSRLSIDNIPALLMDIETSSGARMLTYSLFVSTYPTHSFQIGIIADSTLAYESNRRDVEAVIESIEVRR